MNDLKPYQKPNVPLSPGARFIRGFTRIGAVFAVLTVVIGVPASIVGGINGYSSAVERHEGAQCIARLARSGVVFKRKYEYSSDLDYDVGGCTGGYRFSYNSVAQIIAVADAPAPTFLTSDGVSNLGIGLMITGIIAVVAYLSFWCVGWLCAGFTRDA
jgi:Tfp pilus assembly protein PilE